MQILIPGLGIGLNPGRADRSGVWLAGEIRRDRTFLAGKLDIDLVA